MSRRVVLALSAMLPLVTGCGREIALLTAPDPPPAARPGPAMALAAADLPPGFFPATAVRVLSGLRPGRAGCARLLRVAGGLPDARDVRQEHAAFYLPKPGASLTEHVYRLPPGEAAERLARFRADAASCRSIGMKSGTVRLRRFPLHRRFRDTVAVRYRAGSGDERIGVDLMMARRADALLILAAPGALGGGGAQALERAEGRALRKLRAANL
ncbi:hypothetical protein [Actinomadura macrotermitis]|uniref:Sensor domain-containing protein n=1 Tax=Actinomadura macrotermitis TaxID=2585200 RepID=A0A7K0BPV4_9ACTN|nr:hypothetical protein [Actinomadura macrotermitis]MQY02734.1 hypothetical protein [Actinomadura macrotermitis]